MPSWPQLSQDGLGFHTEIHIRETLWFQTHWCPRSVAGPLMMTAEVRREPDGVRRTWRPVSPAPTACSHKAAPCEASTPGGGEALRAEVGPQVTIGRRQRVHALTPGGRAVGLAVGSLLSGCAWWPWPVQRAQGWRGPRWPTWDGISCRSLGPGGGRQSWVTSCLFQVLRRHPQRL